MFSFCSFITSSSVIRDILVEVWGINKKVHARPGIEPDLCKGGKNDNHSATSAPARRRAWQYVPVQELGLGLGRSLNRQVITTKFARICPVQYAENIALCGGKNHLLLTLN
ncbi:unnamed protein product [Ixodes pacificus]